MSERDGPDEPDGRADARLVIDLCERLAADRGAEWEKRFWDALWEWLVVEGVRR